MGWRRLGHVYAPRGERDFLVSHASVPYAEKLGGDGVAVVVGSASFAIKVGATARHRGVNAGELAASAAQVMGGRGGGGPDFGRGGIKDPAKREPGMALIRETVGRAGGSAV